MVNKRGIPAAVTSTENRENNSYKVFWEKKKGKITLHSYVVNTKSKGTKNVLALASMPPLLGTTKDDGKCKPAILKFYDFSKGGTDIIDQRIGSYSVNTKSRRWTMTAFAYILDITRVNSQTIFAVNNNNNPRELNSFKYGWELAMGLATPHLQERRSQTGITKRTISKINLVLKTPEPIVQHPQAYPAQSNVPRRCKNCLNNIRGPGYAEKYKTLTKGKCLCNRCGNNVCKQHVVTVCRACLQ